MTITIRALTRFEEFLELQQLHQTIWGIQAGLYPPMVNTASQNGGVVLGAFDGERMVGFSFAFLGRHHDGSLKLCSQTTGFLPEYRGQGLGTAIKWAQFDRARQMQIPLITWTFDPLEAPNAYLNLHKLGGTSHTYKVNIYGEHFSRFGEGMPSDRLILEWWLEDERVNRLRQGETPPADPPPAPIINPARGPGLTRKISRLELEHAAAEVLLEIPANIQAMRQSDMSLAREWRFATRKAFQTYFQRGYTAVDVYKKRLNNEIRVYYALRNTGSTGNTESTDH